MELDLDFVVQSFDLSNLSIWGENVVGIIILNWEFVLAEDDVGYWRIVSSVLKL